MEKSHKCFLLRNTRQMLGQTTSDIETASDKYIIVRRNLFCELECLMAEALEHLILTGIVSS